MGSLLTSWTIRTSLVCYLVAVVSLLVRPGELGRYRGFWSAACLLLWAHAGCAFHYHHHWSHSAAVLATAQETQQLLGWRFGAGIWFNYALLGVWSVDVARLWWKRPPRVATDFSKGVHLYAALIFFNGAVVFEQGPVRWVGIAATSVLVWLAWLRLVRRPSARARL